MTNELKEKGIFPICGWDDGKTIYFVYRDKKRQKRIYEIKDFQWYFCIPTRQYENGKESLNKAVVKATIKSVPSVDKKGNKIIINGKQQWEKEKIHLPNPIKTVEKLGDFVKIYCDKNTDETKRLLKFLSEPEFDFEIREADLSLLKRYMIDNMIDIEEDLSVLFFDIETNDENTGIVIGRDEIISWAGCDDKGNIFFEKSEDIETGEQELIMKMLKLFKNYDLIVGWNSKQFDLAYIQTRIDKLGITGENLGEENINVNQTEYWKKIIHVDLMQRLIKLFGPMMTVVNLTGFSLNEVAKVFIGEQKIERAEKVIELYRNNQKKLEEYNKKDVLLVKQINDKLRTLPLMIKECFWTGTFMDSFYIGELLDNYILREASLKNFHLKTRPKWDENDESIKIRGGYVMEPKTGLYDNVRTFDFKSMYPSIIVGWNIGQESLVDGLISDTAQRDFKKWINGRKIEEVSFLEWYEFLREENKKLNPNNIFLQTANNQFFKREPSSIIAGLVKKLLQERKAYKKQQLDSEYNSIEYKNSQASQEAVKEMSNSMYGITADKQARYFDPRIAEAITMTGQFMNRTTMAILEKMRYPVIYGDTDSIFTIVEDDVEMLELTKKLNLELSKHLIKTYKFIDNIIFIEYEKKFRKFIMLDKKRYTGHLIEIDNKKVDSVLSKGTENVRKSTIDFTKNKVNECINLIVKQDKDVKYMKKWIQDLKNFVMNENISGEELSITMKLSKPISSYKSKPPHVRLAEKLIASNEILETHEGKHVWGQKIEYIITDNKNKNEVILLRDFNDIWDRKYYWDVQIYAPLMRILKTVWPETNWEEHNIILFEKLQKKAEQEQQKIEKEDEKKQKQKEKEERKIEKETKKEKIKKINQLSLF